MGHKWLWNESLGGLPSNDFLKGVDPLLDGFRAKLESPVATSEPYRWIPCARMGRPHGPETRHSDPGRSLRRPLGCPGSRSRPGRRGQHRRHFNLHNRDERTTVPDPGPMRSSPRLSRPETHWNRSRHVRHRRRLRGHSPKSQYQTVRPLKGPGTLQSRPNRPPPLPLG